MEQNPCSSRVDRKTVERNRRNQMKSLYSELNSIVPQQSSREKRSLPDRLEEAENYIKKLHLNIEKMKMKKEKLLLDGENKEFNNVKPRNGETLVMDLPKIEIHVEGSTLEVVLITGMDYQFIFSETIRILHEEGVEVINATFSVLDHGTVFHNIHSKVGGGEMDSDMQSLRTTRISERLKNFVYGASLVIIM